MIENKLDLLIKNSNSLEHVKSTFGMGTFKRCNALNLTIRNIDADVNKINDCIDLIRNNSSFFSNFRGNNLLTTAVNLSIQKNPEESFKDIMDIYNKLKNHFFTNQFLVLAAQIIYSYKGTNNVELESIENTDSSIKTKVIETTNSISLNLVIIMQIAASSAAAAAAASSASSSN